MTSIRVRVPHTNGGTEDILVDLEERPAGLSEEAYQEWVLTYYRAKYGEVVLLPAAQESHPLYGEKPTKAEDY